VFGGASAPLGVLPNQRWLVLGAACLERGDLCGGGGAAAVLGHVLDDLGPALGEVIDHLARDRGEVGDAVFDGAHSRPVCSVMRSRSAAW
jgi:hypothetical protein